MLTASAAGLRDRPYYHWYHLLWDKTWTIPPLSKCCVSMKVLFYKAVCIFSPQVLTFPWVKYSINRLFRNSHNPGGRFQAGSWWSHSLKTVFSPSFILHSPPPSQASDFLFSFLLNQSNPHTFHNLFEGVCQDTLDCKQQETQFHLT